MATVTSGYNWVSGENVTPAKLISTGTPTISNITNGDVANNAAIAGTKIAPNFGSQAITTTGNVGIGTVSPSDKLNVSDGTANIQLKPIGASSIGYVGMRSNHALGLTTNDTERMRIDGSGGVGIGTTSILAGSLLNVSQGVAARVDTAGMAPYLQLYNSNAGTDLKTWRIGGGSDGRLSVETVNDAYSAANERVSVTAAGNVGIATATPSYKLHVNGSVAGVGAYNAVSDAREKKNISYDFQHGLQTVRELKPAHFDYLGDGPQNNLGFIAQDIQQVLPGMVTTFNKTVGEGDEATTEERLAIKEANLIAVLVKAVQELDAKVSALEAAQ